MFHGGEDLNLDFFNYKIYSVSIIAWIKVLQRRNDIVWRISSVKCNNFPQGSRSVLSQFYNNSITINYVLKFID